MRLHTPLLTALLLSVLPARQASAGDDLPAGAAAAFETAELMLHTQIFDLALIGLALGPDEGSPLTFVSDIDPTNRLFAYALAPGQTYLGQAATITGSGAFDPGSGQWAITTAGTVGADLSWTTAYSAQVSGDPNGFMNGLWDLVKRAVLSQIGIETNFHYRGTLNRQESNGDVSLFVGATTIWKATETDTFKKGRVPAWKFTFKPESDLSSLPPGFPGRPFKIRLEGDFGSDFPLQGGPGTFTGTLVPVPEPSTEGLFVVGVAVLSAATRFRRKQAARHA